MPLSNRILQVIFTMPSTGEGIVLDQSLHMRVQIQKEALAIRNRATIEITNLTAALREQLASLFTAWDNRKVQKGYENQAYVPVEIKAGYQTVYSQPAPVTVYKGEVTIVNISQAPPNVGIRVTCYTHQIDTTQDISESAPTNATYSAFAKWAGEQMGFTGSNFYCNTSYDDLKVWNPAGLFLKKSALLPKIQDLMMPDVAAFIDDDRMIVKNRNAIIDPSATVTLTEFIGIPTWTEWGMECTTLFNPNIRLAQGVILQSVMNPSLNGTYVVMELEYNLSSRDTEFYVKTSGSPPG
jgi:hypothetical protein